MIRLALQALAGTGIPLGIVPAGTGNDHAREYRLPTSDPAGAVDIIAAGHTETVDLGLIKGSDGSSTWFGTVAATGFDSLVSDRVNRMSWPHGRMRYNLAMVAELSKLRLLPFRMVLDGEREITTRLTLAAFGNTRSYGGGMQICPGANHSDGMLDITMVHSASRSRLIRLFPTVFKGTHVNLDEVTVDRARTITVESPGSTPTPTATTSARCPPDLGGARRAEAFRSGLADGTLAACPRSSDDRRGRRARREVAVRRPQS